MVCRRRSMSWPTAEAGPDDDSLDSTIDTEGSSPGSPRQGRGRQAAYQASRTPSPVYTYEPRGGETQRNSCPLSRTPSPQFNYHPAASTSFHPGLQPRARPRWADVGSDSQAAEDVDAAFLVAKHQPNQEKREKLLRSAGGKIVFKREGLRSEDQAELDRLGLFVLVAHFFKDVAPFLDGEPWSCHAVLKSGSDIRGVVALKSSGMTKISGHIWLRKIHSPPVREICRQIVLQVFGTNLIDKSDVRVIPIIKSSGHTRTCLEVEIACFITGEEGMFQQAPGAVCEVHLPQLTKEDLNSLNTKWLGEPKHFLACAEFLAKQLLKRPTALWSLLKPLDGFTGKWMVGNVFRCAISGHVCGREDEQERRKKLDGQLVVLLPCQDASGSLELQEEVVVGVLDEKRRSIYLVPQNTLTPMGLRATLGEDRVKDLQKVTDFLQKKFEYKVLVKEEAGWREGRLLLQLGGETCKVRLGGREAEIDGSDLRLAKAFKKIPHLMEHQDAATLAHTASTEG